MLIKVHHLTSLKVMQKEKRTGGQADRDSSTTWW